MGSPTVLKLGSWRTTDDSFQPHASSPTGAILDLNDGTTFLLLDSSGLGDGLELGYPRPAIYSSQNPRVVGERVVRRIYNKNREITVRLWVGPAASYAALATAWHNLVGLVEGISPTNPAALQIQVTGASTAVYADVLAIEMEAKYEELMVTQLVDETIVLRFICRPFLRGARQTLQNLAFNPGFEAPSGPAVQVFNDTLATANAYAVQAGGALAQDKTYYPDVVLADSPVNYFRCDEASGSTAYNAGSGANGNYTGTVTFGVTSLLTGDSDAAVTFTAANSNRVTANTALTGGNTAFTVDFLMKFAANPGSTQGLYTNGNATLTNLQTFRISLSTTGHIQVDVGGSVLITSTGALSTGAAHYVAVRYDGAGTLTLNVDNATAQTASSIGTLAIPASPGSHYWGALQNGTSFFSGQMDECADYNGKLSDARITAHYNAYSTTPASASNTLVLASGNRVSFGSPIWSAVNLWSVRLRYFSGATGTFYLHYTDANNYLAAVVTATALTLNHVVGGTTHALGTTSFQLINGLYYWLQVTQFPWVSGNPPYVQAALYEDGLGANQGTVSTQLGSTVAAATNDAVTALTGAPQIAASGASLGIGGNYSNVHTVGLFGPGAWTFNGNTGTGFCSGAWDQSTSNTYPNGPVTSFGAGRVDLAPAGTVDAKWQAYTGGTPAGTWAMPVSAAGDVIYARCAVKSSGLGNGATIKLDYTEYNSSGTSLRSGTLQTLTISGGVQVAWPAAGAYSLSGNWTTGANCAYVDIQLHVADTVAANSANGIVWFDNVQVWDSTATGTTSMPYCELRFPQSPAQLLVSGVQGDVATPAWLGLGVYEASWAAGNTLTYYLGRRAYASAGTVLTGASIGQTVNAPASLNTTYVLDSSAYNGYLATVTGGGFLTRNGRVLWQHTSAIQGSYHLLKRVFTSEASPAANLTTNLYVIQRTKAGFGDTVTSSSSYLLDILAQWQINSSQQTFATGNAWNIVDAGYLSLPPTGNIPALADASQTYYEPFMTTQDTNSTTFKHNWEMLLPVDTSALILTLANSGGFTSTTSYVYQYVDPFQALMGPPAYPSYSIETAALSNPAKGAAGYGTDTSYYQIKSTADPYLTLDPNLSVGTSTGVNQIAAVVTDNTGAVLSLIADAEYTPLYLMPK